MESYDSSRNISKSYRGQLEELTQLINRGRYSTLQRNNRRILLDDHKRMIAADINLECDRLIDCLGSVNIGLVGRKNVGKTTIFQEFTQEIVDPLFTRQAQCILPHSKLNLTIHDVISMEDTDMRSLEYARRLINENLLDIIVLVVKLDDFQSKLWKNSYVTLVLRFIKIFYDCCYYHYFDYIYYFLLLFR